MSSCTCRRDRLEACSDCRSYGPTIEENIYGAQLSQPLLDRVHARAVCEGNGSGVVDIIVRNVSVLGFGMPRLILDYGQVYEQLERAVQRVKGADDERERCIRILEARKQGRGASFADIIDSLLKEIRDQEPDGACL